MQLVILVGKQYKQCLHNFIFLQTLEMRFFKNIVLVSLSVLLIWWAFALPRWTSFWKTQNPIALPPTQIISWGTVSGDYVSWWTVIADLGTNASGWVIIDNLYNSSGVEYTAWATPGLRTGDWTTLYPVQTWETRLKIWEWAISSSSYSMAIGNYTHSNSDFSTALWYDTKANWLGSLAIWYATKANWTFSTAMGISTTAGGSFSTAMGNLSVAGWDYSIAGGNTASAVGVSSVALGNNVQANWNFSIAMWDYAKADWYNGIAMGSYTEANGQSSLAVWGQSVANGFNAVAMGNNTLAEWDTSFAMGSFSKAYWVSSSAIGISVITYTNGGMAIGNYNEWITGALFEIGNWEWGAESNVLEVYSTWIQNNWIYNQWDSTGSYNIEVANTPLNFGAVLDVYWPVITPNAYVPGIGAYPAIITKGMNFFLDEDGADMYLSNVDWTFATVFNSRGDEAKFSLAVMSWNLMSTHNAWTFDLDGTIKSELIDPTPYITDDKDFTTKKYVDTALTDYVPYTAVDTGFNNTGSDTIIPSEKAVWSLVSWLNNNYVPFWDGSKFINRSIFRTIDFLSLAHISTWAFLRISSDFIYASTDIVDWKITENRFKIWSPDSSTTGVYIEWKMLDWVIDVYADTGVNLNTTDVVITGNIYADWSSVKFNTKSFVWWFNSSVGGIKSASIWHNCQANGDFSVAIWSYSQAIWDSSISMWNQVKAYAHSSTALWRHTEARSAYWVVMGRYNVGNTDSLLEIWDGTSTTWYNEFEFKKDGRFIISEEWSFILNASGNLDVQYLSGSSWVTADTFTKS